MSPILSLFVFACSMPNPPEETKHSSTPSAVMPQNTPSGSGIPEAKPEDAPEELTVTYTGTVTYKGEATGAIIMEVLDNTTGEPRLVAQTTLTEVGDFSIDLAPRNPELNVMVYIDITGDRISEDDPRGYLKITDAQNPQTGLNINILDNEALKRLKEQEGVERTDPKEDPKEKE